MPSVERVVPQVSQTTGFVAGYWTRKDTGGSSMVVFESEDAAQRLPRHAEGHCSGGSDLRGR